MPKVIRCPQCKGKLFVLCVEGQKKRPDRVLQKVQIIYNGGGYVIGTIS